MAALPSDKKAGEGREKTDDYKNSRSEVVGLLDLLFSAFQPGMSILWRILFDSLRLLPFLPVGRMLFFWACRLSRMLHHRFFAALAAITIQFQTMVGDGKAVRLLLNGQMFQGAVLQRHLSVAFEADGVVGVVGAVQAVESGAAVHHGGLCHETVFLKNRQDSVNGGDRQTILNLRYPPVEFWYVQGLFRRA